MEVRTIVSTQEAILLTQIPIAVGILIGAYILHDIKRELIAVLEKLVELQEKNK